MLTSGLFVLLLMISVGIIDISDAYLAKRELIQIGESSVSHAAQSLDSTRYYEDGILNSGGRVPIDCNSANLMFQDEMAHKSLRKNSIDVITFECTPEQITAEISSNIVGFKNSHYCHHRCRLNGQVNTIKIEPWLLVNILRKLTLFA